MSVNLVYTGKDGEVKITENAPLKINTQHKKARFISQYKFTIRKLSTVFCVLPNHS
jgi:hypothetical protein